MSGLFFYIFIHSAVAFGFLIGYYILSDDPEVRRTIEEHIFFQSIRKFAQERNLSHVIKDLNLSKEVFIFLNSDAIWFKLLGLFYFVYSFNRVLDIALISIICFVIIYVSGVSYLTHWKFHRKLIISPEKLKQQRNITAMLVLQVFFIFKKIMFQGTLPLVLLVFPIIAFVSIFLADPYYQMMYASFAFDVLYFTLSLFPLLNICVAVTMIRAYRLLLFEIVKLRRLHERGSFVVTNLG